MRSTIVLKYQKNGYQNTTRKTTSMFLDFGAKMASKMEAKFVLKPLKIVYTFHALKTHLCGRFSVDFLVVRAWIFGAEPGILRCVLDMSPFFSNPVLSRFWEPFGLQLGSFLASLFRINFLRAFYQFGCQYWLHFS